MKSSLLRGLCPAALFLLLSAPPTCAKVRYVEPDGFGDYAKIQDAVDASSNGDVIVLADGVYTGDRNRDIDFGGRLITVESQSGNPATCTMDSQGSYPDYHRAFIFQTLEDSTAVVKDITITGGVVGGA